MDEKKDTKRGSKPKVVKLGPGVHAATVELAIEDRFRVRTYAGDSVTARLGDGVQLEFVQECMRAGRPVLLNDGPKGPLILGAIQTESVSRSTQDGAISMNGETLSLTAETAIELKVGESSLVLHRDGLVEIRGDMLRIEQSKLIRLVASKVELP